MHLVATAPARALLAAHLIRCTPVIEKAVTVLRPEDLCYRDEQVLQLLWAISRDWFLSARRPIPPMYLSLEITKRLQGDPEFAESLDTEELLNTVTSAYTVDETTFNPEYVLTAIQEFVDSRRVGQAISDAAGGMDPLDARLEKLMRVYSSTRISQGQVADIFSDAAKQFVFPPKDPFGIAFIDTLLDGGSLIGEVYGLLGVSGMGKSILGQQMAIEKARRRKHVAVFHYEMDLYPTVVQRIYAYLADIPRDVLKSAPTVSQLPQQYLQKLEKAEDGFAREYLHVIDMKASRSAGAGGMQDVRAQLRELDMQGKHVEFVVIDQLMPMVKRAMSAGNLKIDAATQRVLMQRFVDEAIVMARPNDMATSVMIIHQSSSDVKQRKAVVKPKQGESLEDRAFDNWLTYCLAIGTQDEEQRCWCVTTKARGNPKDGCIVQLNPRLPRFDYEPGKFVADRSGFISTRVPVGAFVPGSTRSMSPPEASIIT